MLRWAGSLVRANKDDLDKLLDVQNELDVPVRVDTYMMPATRERESALQHAVPSGSGGGSTGRSPCAEAGDGAGAVSSVYFSSQWTEQITRNLPRPDRGICPAWPGSVRLPSTGRGRCAPA